MNKVKDYLECEIKERELVIKKLSKLSFFLTVFSSVFFHILKQKTYRIGNLSFYFVFFFNRSNNKKKLYEIKKKKKKHNKVLYLTKNKLDCIEMLISQFIMDLNISHDEFKMTMNEKKDYDN